MVLWSLGSLQPTNHEDIPSSSSLYFFYLIYSCAIHPPPSLLCTEVHPVCRHPFGIMLHVQANCAAKRIISVHCRLPVNQSSLCVHHNPPSPHTHPARLFPQRPLTLCLQGKGAIHNPAPLLMSGPRGPIGLGVPHGLQTSLPGSQ